MKTTSRPNRKLQLAFGSAIVTSIVVGAISYRGMIMSGETIPTFILTTSGAAADIVKSHQLQPKRCVRKTVQLAAFEHLVKSINDFWLTKAKLPQHG